MAGKVSYGQSGYVGSSMSERAAAAYGDGEAPKSKWSKKAMLAALRSACDEAGLQYEPDKVEALLKDEIFERFFEWKSWHHTSKYANETDFYGVAEDRLAESFEPMGEEALAAREEAREQARQAEERALERQRALMEAQRADRRAAAAERESWAQQRGYYPDSVAAALLARPECARAWVSLNGNPTVAVRTASRGWVSCGLDEAWRRGTGVDVRTDGGLVEAKGQPYRPESGHACELGAMPSYEPGRPRGEEPSEGRWRAALEEASRANPRVAELLRKVGMEPPGERPYFNPYPIPHIATGADSVLEVLDLEAPAGEKPARVLGEALRALSVLGLDERQLTLEWDFNIETLSCGFNADFDRTIDGFGVTRIDLGDALVAAGAVPFGTARAALEAERLGVRRGRREIMNRLHDEAAVGIEPSVAAWLAEAAEAYLGDPDLDEVDDPVRGVICEFVGWLQSGDEFGVPPRPRGAAVAREQGDHVIGTVDSEQVFDAFCAAAPASADQAAAIEAALGAAGGRGTCGDLLEAWADAYGYGVDDLDDWHNSLDDALVGLGASPEAFADALSAAAAGPEAPAPSLTDTARMARAACPAAAGRAERHL